MINGFGQHSIFVEKQTEKYTNYINERQINREKEG